MATLTWTIPNIENGVTIYFETFQLQDLRTNRISSGHLLLPKHKLNSVKKLQIKKILEKSINSSDIRFKNYIRKRKK